MSRFWKHKATVFRQSVLEGPDGFMQNQEIEVYKDIKCHLSKSVSARGKPYETHEVSVVDYEFTLFCSKDLTFEINDVVEVITPMGEFRLYAGVSATYEKTSQVPLSFTPTSNEAKDGI